MRYEFCFGEKSGADFLPGIYVIITKEFHNRFKEGGGLAIKSFIMHIG